MTRTRRLLAERAGGMAVPLEVSTGPAFDADLRRTLASDGLHPSDDGYRLWAAALLCAMQAAVA